MDEVGRQISLTKRELEVLGLACEGRRNSEIADDLFISVNTVEFHLKNIYVKLQVHSRIPATRRALRFGLIPR